MVSRLCSIAQVATLIFVTGYTLRAQASQVTALVGMNVSAPSYSSAAVAQSITGTPGIAWGVLAATAPFYPFEFETGFIYESVKFSDPVGTTSTDYQFAEIQVPFVVRYKLDQLVGIGFGPYLGIGTGDVTRTSGGTATHYTFSDLNLFSNDFGFLFNIQVLIPIQSTLAVTIDGRYQFGINERARDLNLNSYKTRSIQALVGLSYFF